MYNKNFITLLLLFLVILDLALSTICLYSPELWFKIMHGTGYADSLGIIRRLGAVWFAFLVFQSAALFLWKKQAWWLVLVAGIRFTEIFSDWVYWYFAENLTWFGYFGLLISPPANLFFGIILIKSYLQFHNEKPL
ncbi:MAG: hypothetical protein HYY40_02740 [Bacteroidetes bacterium]|nr:hypothetical protein [Bacteroidota bacterium]